MHIYLKKTLDVSIKQHSNDVHISYNQRQYLNVESEDR